MYKNILPIGIFSFVLILASCVKLDEGPSYSLFTKKQRLAREWVIDSLTGPSNASSIFLDNAQMNDLRLIFDKDNSLKCYEMTDAGVFQEILTTWDWFHPSYSFQSYFGNTISPYIQGQRTYVIKRLTRNNLILEDYASAVRLYFHSR